jgi:hypothetical protein
MEFYAANSAVGLKGERLTRVLPTLKQLQIHVVLPEKRVLFADAIDAIGEKIFHVRLIDRDAAATLERARQDLFKTEERFTIAQYYAVAAISNWWLDRVERIRDINALGFAAKSRAQVNALWYAALKPILVKYSGRAIGVFAEGDEAQSEVYRRLIRFRRRKQQQKERQQQLLLQQQAQQADGSAPLSPRDMIQMHTPLAHFFRQGMVEIEEEEEQKEDDSWKYAIEDAGSSSGESWAEEGDNAYWRAPNRRGFVTVADLLQRERHRRDFERRLRPQDQEALHAMPLRTRRRWEAAPMPAAEDLLDAPPQPEPIQPLTQHLTSTSTSTRAGGGGSEAPAGRHGRGTGTRNGGTGKGNVHSATNDTSTADAASAIGVGGWNGGVGNARSRAAGGAAATSDNASNVAGGGPHDSLSATSNGAAKASAPSAAAGAVTAQPFGTGDAALLDSAFAVSAADARMNAASTTTDAAFLANSRRQRRRVDGEGAWEAAARSPGDSPSSAPYVSLRSSAYGATAKPEETAAARRVIATACDGAVTVHGPSRTFAHVASLTVGRQAALDDELADLESRIDAERVLQARRLAEVRVPTKKSGVATTLHVATPGGGATDFSRRGGGFDRGAATASASATVAGASAETYIGAGASSLAALREAILDVSARGRAQATRAGVEGATRDAAVIAPPPSQQQQRRHLGSSRGARSVTSSSWASSPHRSPSPVRREPSL